jgi:hypothetical protein
MTKGIDKQMTDQNPRINDSFNQSRFSDFLAKMCCLKDDPDATTAHYEKLYRWTWQLERIMKTDNEASTIEEFMKRYEEDVVHPDSPLGEGWKWLLQIKCEQKWWNWIYLKECETQGGGLGVFSARDFPVGSIVGYYVGDVIFEDKTEGGKKPSSESVASGGGIETKLSVAVRSRKGFWQVVSPKVVTENAKGHFPLFMGLHYMHTASSNKKENCFLCPDGSIQCKHKITKNQEMVLGYNTEVRVSNGGVDDDFNYDMEMTVDGIEEEGGKSEPVSFAGKKNARSASGSAKGTKKKARKSESDEDNGKETKKRKARRSEPDEDDGKATKKRPARKTKEVEEDMQQHGEAYVSSEEDEPKAKNKKKGRKAESVENDTKSTKKGMARKAKERDDVVEEDSEDDSSGDDAKATKKTKARRTQSVQDDVKATSKLAERKSKEEADGDVAEENKEDASLDKDNGKATEKSKSPKTKKADDDDEEDEEEDEDDEDGRDDGDEGKVKKQTNAGKNKKIDKDEEESASGDDEADAGDVEVKSAKKKKGVTRVSPRAKKGSKK